MKPRLVKCQTCDGAGEWDEGPLPAHSAATEPEYRQVKCPACEGKGQVAFQIEEGETYRNGRGDDCGPMEERTPGCFIDQHGAIYHPNGLEWNHIEGSTANLIELTHKNGDRT